MTIKSTGIKLSELCFYIFFCTLLFAKGFGLYDGQPVFKILLLIALAACGGKLILTAYTKRELLICGLLILLGSAIYLISHEKGAILLILLVCSMKNIETKKVFRVGLVTWIISFGSMFLLTSTHLMESAFKVHDKLGLGRIIRWNLGYAHPNVLHISYLVLTLFIIYIIQEQITLKKLLLLELGNLYIFIYSLSATGFLAVTACLLLVFYWSIRKKLNQLEAIAIQLFLPVCLLISLVCPVLLKGRAFDLLNKLVNTRLELSQWFLLNQPIQLFGVDTTKIVTSQITMDNSYLFALITYGLVLFIIIVISYILLIYRKIKKQDGIALCIILTCLLAGVTEPFLFNTSFKNISLLFLPGILFGQEKGLIAYSLPFLKDREISIPTPDLHVSIFSFSKKMLSVACICGILAGVIVYVTCPMPSRYLLPRKAFEYTDDIEETYYLTSSQDIQESGDQILGYESETVDMVPFSGNIALVERARNTMQGGLLTFFAVYLIGNMVAFVRSKKKDTVNTDGK